MACVRHCNLYIILHCNLNSAEPVPNLLSLGANYRDIEWRTLAHGLSQSKGLSHSELPPYIL
jgi:hypothetical protein